MSDGETLKFILAAVQETAARAVRIETRLSRLLVEMGMGFNGATVPHPERMPEALPRPPAA